VVRVGRETKGRRGKGVTIVSDVPLNEAGLQELAARLKQRCGTGGMVKDGRIEIQGDQRDRLIAELEGLGYARNVPVADMPMPRVMRKTFAWCVHAYTALGLVAAAGIAASIVDGTPASFRFAFILMLAATLIDATDGTLARAVGVKSCCPALMAGASTISSTSKPTRRCRSC